MIRRSRTVVALAAALVGAGPAGGSAGAADDVAEVNGVAISVDEFEHALEQLGGVGTVTGDQARAVLTQLVVNEAMRQALVEGGADPAAGDEPPEGTPEVIAERDRYQELLAGAGLVDLSEVQAEYEATGMAAGQICLRLFTVEDGDAGADAMAALEDGATFDEVAAEHDPQYQTTGGSVTGDPEQPCVDATGLTEAAQPIVDAVADVGAGKPAGPVDTEIGTVIVIAPPFDEVSDALDDELLAGALAGIIAEADVQIDPRYGRWDAAAGSVVALGQP